MTTQEWISKNYRNNDGNTKHFASVMKDRHGTIYSYGFHYPLLMHVAGINWVNNAGYSMTTAKHIGWAHSAVSYDTHNVKLELDDIDRLRYANENDQALVIHTALERELAILEGQMQQKKRKDTQVYAMLETQRQTLLLSLRTLHRAMFPGVMA